MHVHVYNSVYNDRVNSEQLGHRGIDVFVRHKEIFPNCQMIKFQCKRANNHGRMDSIHQGKFVVYE